MDLKGKHVAVIGAKRSGLAARDLLAKQGARVRLLDSASQDSSVLPQTEASLAPPLDLVVPSPGVPLDLPLLANVKVPVIGEVELASYFLRGPVIGITGSNGKTTTTALVGHLLRECGIRCQVGGNIGTAVTALVDTSRDDQWNVLELSSFQLETVSHFRARIAACLNVTPDHLDRHHTFEAYAAAKRKLFETQQPGDEAVLNKDDEWCRLFAESTTGNVHWFSVKNSLDGDRILLNGEPFMERRESKLRGLHNVENILAACSIASLAGAKLAQLGPAVATFPGVEHRIEFVRALDGVDYFNDSKATNVDATLKAIAAFNKDLWIILGGKDKGSDYRPLREPLTHARGALLIGAATPLIAQALDSTVPLIDCGTLRRALLHARQHAQPGDTVLLAPACASFDQYENYEARGRDFKQIVRNLS